MRKTSFLLFLALTALGCSRNPPSPGPSPDAATQRPSDDPSELIRIAVVQTNDIHGALLPHKVALGGWSDPAGPVDLVGGVEAFAGYLSILRHEFDGKVLLLDAGDMFQGTLLSNRFEGAPVLKAMEHLGYTAATLGNHEFDFGPSGDDSMASPEADPLGAIKDRGRQAAFPILACNVYDRSTGQRIQWEGFAPYRLTQIGGVTIGIVGGATPGTPAITPPVVGQTLEFRPLPEEISSAADEVRSKGATVVVAVVHTGSACKDNENPDDLSSCEVDSELFQVARAASGRIDLLVGAHTHAFVSHNVHGVPTLESGSSLEYFGMAVLSVDPKTRKVASIEISKPVPMCLRQPEGGTSCVGPDFPANPRWVPATYRGETVTPGSFLEDLLSPPERAALEEARRPMGVEVSRNLLPSREASSPVGLMVTGVLQKRFPELDGWLYNESGIRAPLFRGPMAFEDLYEVLPFDATPYRLSLTGKQLVDLLRLATSGAHSLPIIRGFVVTVDVTRDPCISQDWDRNGTKEPWERNRLVSVTLPDGSPLDPAKVYTLGTNSYLARGGSDFSRVLGPLGPEIASELSQSTIRNLVSEWLSNTPGIVLGAPDDNLTSPKASGLVLLHLGETSPEACP